MRILYGIFAQGHGHFSKAAVLAPLLERRGHEVRVISSGADAPPAGYRFTWHRHFPGLSYVVTDGHTDYKRTFSKWIREAPRVLRHLWALRALVREFQPDVILSDFEPLSACPLLQAGCEVVALSRQIALFDRTIPLPEEMAFERKVTRTVVRMFTAGADRLFGYHYEPTSFRCVPPVIRPDLHCLRPEFGDHFFVYNHYHTADGGTGAELVEWARRNRVEVVAYGFPEMPRGLHGSVDFRLPNRARVLEDMRTSRGVMTTAGLSTPLEAFLLDKPAVTVPIPGHYEQFANAFHLEQAGIAGWSRTWNFDRLLEQPTPALDHRLSGWLRTPVERIIDHVLETRPHHDDRRLAAPLADAA